MTGLRQTGLRRLPLAAVGGAAVLVLALGACTSSPERSGDGVSNPLAHAKLDYSGTYTITSEFRGDSECLDANTAHADPGHGGAFLASCNGGEPQTWRVQPLTPGVYQLVAKQAGEDVCLNGNHANSPVNDGAAFTEPCRAIADQAWTVEPTAGGHFRLHSRLYADSSCLESNEAGSTVHAGSVFMNDCQEVSGQQWYLEEV